MQRERAFTNAPWEKKVGYCRAVRAGDLIFVTGTAPVAEDGSVHAPGNPYEQTKRCFEIIGKALGDLGAGFEHVVRTRMFVTDIARWEAVAQVHGEVFADVRPVTTLVEVSGFVHPDMLVEIEADAVLT